MEIRLLLQSFCVRLCYAKYGEIHCCCVCSAKNILASEKRKHTMKDSWKQDWKQPAQFHTANFWQTFNSFCCFSRKHIYLCDVTTFSREGARTNWTDSVLEPASLSAHVVTIQRMSRNQACSTDSQSVHPPKDDYREVPMEKVCACTYV